MAVGLGYRREANGLFVPELQETQSTQVVSDEGIKQENKGETTVEKITGNENIEQKPSDENLKTIEEPTQSPGEGVQPLKELMTEYAKQYPVEFKALLAEFAGVKDGA